MKIKRTLWVFVIIIAAVAAAWGPIVSNVEQAKYTVVEKYDDIEIRDYDPMIVAEVSVPGEREKAISQGFRLIADYIFGNNAPLQQVAMTAPVTQQSQTIAMTAPVTQQAQNSLWIVRFVMPSSYNIDTLPKPNNSEVKLRIMGGKRFAAIRFSGIGRNDMLKQKEADLQAFIHKQQLQMLAPAIYAFFNPPWTLPFLRRNEVMIEIAKP